MKFEQLLQIYWSKGFLYGGKVESLNTNFNEFFNSKKGLAYSSKIAFFKRFEFNKYTFKNNNKFILLQLDQKKIINMYLSQIISINNNIFELIKYNLIKLYLIKSYRGRAQALGKPSRGQRTWSNAWNSYKCNKVIRFFIKNMKSLDNKNIKKNESLNLKIGKVKIKKVLSKTKTVKIIKKKNLWF